MDKCIHLLLATTLLGLTAFNYIFIQLVTPNTNKYLSIKCLKRSAITDITLLVMGIAALISGAIITPLYQWTYATPWIKAAFIFISLCIILWGCNVALKINLLKKINSLKAVKISYSYHIINFALLIIIIILIKDAVTKTTWIIK